MKYQCWSNFGVKSEITTMKCHYNRNIGFTLENEMKRQNFRNIGFTFKILAMNSEICLGSTGAMLVQ